MPGFDEYIGLYVDGKGNMQQPPASSMRRIHILYVVHDVLVTITNWMHTSSAPARYADLDLNGVLNIFKQHVMLLTQLAACSEEQLDGGHVARPLHQLIERWQTLDIFPADDIRALKKMADEAKDTPFHDASDKYTALLDTQSRNVPQEDKNTWILPHRHGVKHVPDAPWHELPAANGLYMRETRGYPLRAAAFPQGGYELKNGGSPPNVP